VQIQYVLINFYVVMKTKFTKMHGMGNDFVVFEGSLELSTTQIKKLCDRHIGVGADAIILVTGLSGNQIRMQYWNADGSKAEMCGNGLRCSAHYAVKNGLVKPGNFVAQTGSGPLQVVWNGKNAEHIEIQVGKVELNPSSVQIEGTNLYIANVGNPHAVTFVQTIDTAPVKELGQKIENNSFFPNRTNVEFVKVLGTNAVKMRVWERGVGETLSCTTAIVAVANVAAMVKSMKFPISVEVSGGRTEVWIDDEGYSRMQGPSEIVFEGDVEI
jgi:diaminopimelate epimerase